MYVVRCTFALLTACRLHVERTTTSTHTYASHKSMLRIFLWIVNTLGIINFCWECSTTTTTSSRRRLAIAKQRHCLLSIFIMHQSTVLEQQRRRPLSATDNDDGTTGYITITTIVSTFICNRWSDIHRLRGNANQPSQHHRNAPKHNYVHYYM